MAQIPRVKPGDSNSLWSAKGAAPVIAAANRVAQMKALDPLELVVTADGGLELRLKDGATLPGAGDGGKGGTGFPNTPQSHTANCPGGTSGPPITVTVAANTLSSPISQADADAMALELATDRAVSLLVCNLAPLFDDGIDGMAINSTGQIVVWGNFTHVNGYSRPCLALLDSLFSLQPQCWKMPLHTGPTNPISSVCLDASDNIYLLGQWLANVDVQYWQMIAQLSPDGGIVGSYTSPTFAPPTITGSYPATFGPPPRIPSHLFYDVTGNRVLIGGTFLQYGNTATQSVIAINTTTGALDGSFAWTGAGFVLCCGISDGGGAFYMASNGGGTGGFVMVSAAGTVSGAFQPWTYGGSSFSTVTSMFLMGGWLYVGGLVWLINSGAVNSYGIVRFDPATGQWDNTFWTYTHKAFNNATDVISIAAQGTQILVGGTFSTYNNATCPANLLRLNTNGDLDTAWTCQTNGRVTKIIVEVGGTILVCGYFTQIGPAGSMVARSRIARLTSAGVVL